MLTKRMSTIKESIVEQKSEISDFVMIVCIPGYDAYFLIKSEFVGPNKKPPVPKFNQKSQNAYHL